MRGRARTISFRELQLKNDKTKFLFRIFYPTIDGRSDVMERFRSLPMDDQENIKSLIYRMAKIGQSFQSYYVKWNLTGRHLSYGEISLSYHRFFFFRYTNFLVFFFYIEKKTNQLNDAIYRNIQRQKDLYEREFAKFINRG